MFQICLRPKTVVIEGCPLHGLAAIDFRRAHGISAEPTNTIALYEFDTHGPDPREIGHDFTGKDINGQCEKIVRQFPQLADDCANIYYRTMPALTLPPSVIRAYLAADPVPLLEIVAREIAAGSTLFSR